MHLNVALGLLGNPCRGATVIANEYGEELGITREEILRFPAHQQDIFSGEGLGRNDLGIIRGGGCGHHEGLPSVFKPPANGTTYCCVHWGSGLSIKKKFSSKTKH